MAQSRLADAASGMVAGTAGVLIGHPIDTVRVNVIVRGMRPSEAASRILREAGVRGLFRGVLPPLLTNGLGERARCLLFAREACARSLLHAGPSHPLFRSQSERRFSRRLRPRSVRSDRMWNAGCSPRA